MARWGFALVDSADKAARFIWLCDAFNIPFVFLADAPRFHDRHEKSNGKESLRAGAEIIAAVSLW